MALLMVRGDSCALEGSTVHHISDSCQHVRIPALSDANTTPAGTSLPLMHKIVDMIRAKEPDTPVVLSYEDQPQVREESLPR